MTLAASKGNASRLHLLTVLEQLSVFTCCTMLFLLHRCQAALGAAS